MQVQAISSPSLTETGIYLLQRLTLTADFTTSVAFAARVGQDQVA